jgi:tripartite-type tricarboxylate transporter receptor subunit TctC
MTRRSFLHAAGASALATSLPAQAQAYPSRTVRLVVPFPPGGPTDAFARLYAAGLARELGQPVVVENKAGASGAVGSMDVMRSAPDGHSLLFGTASTHALYNLIQPKPQYDALKDFAYVGVLGGAPIVFAVAPSMPRTLKTVLIAARLNPGKYSYGSPGSGTLMHVSAERLKQMSGASFTHVAYKGSAPALQDLLAGVIDMTVDTLGTLLPQHEAGRLRIVGVAAAKRVDVASGIPTVAESADLPAPFEAMLWNVVTAPRDTPKPVLATLADATRRTMNDPGLRSQLASRAMFADLHLGDAAAQAYVVAERAKWQPIISTLGDLISG